MALLCAAMLQKLPDFIDPVACALHHKAFEAQVKQSRFKRLSEAVVDADEWVAIWLKFYPFSSDRSALEAYAFDLTVETRFWLQCQRSLQTFAYPVSMQMTGVFVESLTLLEQTEDTRLQAMVAFELPQEQVALQSLIEDELLLQIPLAPINTTAPMPAYTPGDAQWDDQAVAQQSVSEQSHPFASLQSLKDKSKNCE